ncbi:MAG: amidohydrolase [Pseudomonadota bacterium]|nr:amidohydrolase [Pseudomonadota bacterium]
MFFNCMASSHEHCDHGSATGFAQEAGVLAATTDATPAAAPAKRRSKQGLRVDFHCHYQHNEVAAKAAPLKPVEREPSIVYASAATRQVNQQQMKERGPKLSDIATRLADMDRMCIDVQAVSPSPSQYYYYADPAFGLELARDINDRLAEIAAGHPDRFVGMGTVPLQDPKLAVRELERCVKKLGMRGIEIGTNVNGIDLADPRLRLEKFFAKAQELDVVLFMHPMGFTHADRMTEHYFNNIIGNPLESTLAVSHLIFGGVLDRHPKLKFCVAHGGGYLAHYHARMDHGWKARPDARTVLKKKPSSYLKRFWFDTITFDTGLLQNLVERVGAKQVLMGSDYPYDMGDDDPVGRVSELALDEVDRDRILGGNAARLLGIKSPRNAKGAR